MRRKLFVGVFLAAIVAISAGEFLFSRGDAQDAPKKIEVDEKKSETNLFDVLKKSLEDKSNATSGNQEIPPPILPPKPGELPALPGLSATAQPVPPPTPPELPKAPTLPLVKDEKTPIVPPVAETEKPKVDEKPIPAPKLIEPMKPKSEVLEFPALPAEKAPPTTALPQPAIKPPQPESEFKPPVPVNPMKLTPDLDIPLTQKTVVIPPSAPASPMQPIAAEVAKLKNCPWTLQVEMIDGQTVVVATVNKKHEFKVVCQSLDLQTGKGTLKASGKVQISGDTMNGSCEHLAISLMEDRLVLEGGASVSIQKLSTNVSGSPPAAFELHGEKLDLRISELQSSQFQPTSSRKTINVDANIKQAAAITPEANDKRWTAYGSLKRVYRKNPRLADTSIWQLEDRAGKAIAVLVARDGGSLSQFEGQTISVLGAHEQLEGESVLRVTHIALPR